MASEAEKRTLSASSEDSIDNRARMDDEMPSWARALIADVAHIRNNTNAIMHTVEDLKNEMRGVKSDVEGLEDKFTRLENRQMLTDQQLKANDKRLAKAEEEIVSLKEDNKKLHGEVNSLTDNSMRDTLTVHNIPRKIGKESWTDTEDILANFLANNTNQSAEQWLEKITRAHRGKPSSNVIHVLFRNWKWAQEVQEVFRLKKGKIGTTFCLEKFSIPTQERRSLAQKKRESYRKDFPGTKMWIKYPATLMAKHERDENYQPLFFF